jgi:CBS domain-containing protein
LLAVDFYIDRKDCSEGLFIGMKAGPPIKDFMTKNPRTIDLFESASAAEKVMNAKGIHHLPVVDGKKAYGLISDRDITVARRAYQRGGFDGKVLVRDICLEAPLTVSEDTPITKVAQLMTKKKQDGVLIVRDDVLIGIFTTTDTCRFIAEIFEGGTATESLWSRLFR